MYGWIFSRQGWAKNMKVSCCGLVLGVLCQTASGDDAEGWWWWWCGHLVGSVWLKEGIWAKKVAGAWFQAVGS